MYYRDRQQPAIVSEFIDICICFLYREDILRENGVERKAGTE
jgi:hypothetical protein